MPPPPPAASQNAPGMPPPPPVTGCPPPPPGAGMGAPPAANGYPGMGAASPGGAMHAAGPGMPGYNPAGPGQASGMTSLPGMGPGMGPNTGMGGGQPGAPDPRIARALQDIAEHNTIPKYVRATLGRVPSSAFQKAKVPIPLGVIIQPMAAPDPGEEDLPSVNFSGNTILRCMQCRTYINPFVVWQDNGRRWQCNMCGKSQNVPDHYFAALDETGRRSDRYQKPELCRGEVEYIASSEYCVRPPQPPVFMFVINVSFSSVASGMLDSVVAGIKDAIASGSIPGGQRTQVGIITYDSSLHFYNLNPNLSQPQMLVVSDLDDLFLPLPEDILVNLAESESAILNLLDSLPTIFAENRVSESCFGSAVKGAFMAMKHVGGKLIVCDTCIPSVGEKTLKSTRDNPRLLGTDREVELLRPVDKFVTEGDSYKDFAIEMTRAQVTVEMFVAAQGYVDLASMVPLAKYTGGDLRYYPRFHTHQQGLKMKTELVHVLTRHMGWEAVMRVRASKGWKITKCYGHLFIRGTDLMVVPNCHSDQTFTVLIDVEESATPDPILCLQSALLYTNSDGERRIRVHTWAAATTQSQAEILDSVDAQAAAAVMAQVNIETSFKGTLAEGRNKLQAQCQQIIGAQSQRPIEALQFVPLYIMGMLKSMAFRGTVDVTADMRTAIWSRLETLSVPCLCRYFMPRLLAVHNMADPVGLTDERGVVQMPDMLNLSSESLSQDGAYLLEDGEAILLWIGRGVNAHFLQSTFGVAAIEQLDPSLAGDVVGRLENPVSQRLASVISEIRREHFRPHLQLHVVRHGDAGRELEFFGGLIEDRTAAMQSTYGDFLQRMGYRPPTQQAPPGGGAPPMGMQR